MWMLRATMWSYDVDVKGYDVDVKGYHVDVVVFFFFLCGLFVPYLFAKSFVVLLFVC